MMLRPETLETSKCLILLPEAAGVTDLGRRRSRGKAELSPVRKEQVVRHEWVVAAGCLEEQEGTGAERDPIVRRKGCDTGGVLDP